MRILLDHPLYREDLIYAANLALPWERLSGRSILLSGATGMIGSFLIDVLMHKNQRDELNCHIYALGRSEEKARARFPTYMDDDRFDFIPCDIHAPMEITGLARADYVLHLASNTHPLAYAKDPIGTITANVFGTYHLLEFAAAHKAMRFLFASSNEIYGENHSARELFGEQDCGYLDCNTLRAGYPESKRCAEALCQAYISQKQMDVVIPRLTRSYGPTLLSSDTKALSQFLKKALAGEDIVLKSAGTQYFSYAYAADSVAGLLYVLLLGECGEAYNIADTASDIRLRDLAELVAESVGRKVVFDLPEDAEAAGYSRATRARLDGSKLKRLGWRMHYDIESGIRRTLAIMKETKE